MDFRVFSRNISENMHTRCVREDTKQALKENLQADGVQSRQTLFVRYCLNGNQKCNLRQKDLIGFLKCDKQQRHKVVYHCLHNIADKTGVHRLLIRASHVSDSPRFAAVLPALSLPFWHRRSGWGADDRRCHSLLQKQ